MSLEDYEKKRHFENTPEPSTKPKQSKKSDHQSLIFVVQEHHASHLHYDFRLELGGVLKSWAVPKGPPHTSTDKRLAIEVEDHPFSYANFEGTIPKGNYGAGEVYLWDSGTYAANEDLSKKDNEITLKKGLKDGHLTFSLNGKKLQGHYALIRLKQNPKQWLFLKKP